MSVRGRLAQLLIVAAMAAAAIAPRLARADAVHPCGVPLEAWAARCGAAAGVQVQLDFCHADVATLVVFDAHDAHDAHDQRSDQRHVERARRALTFR